MSLILPANSLTGGYEIDNSLRFNDGSSDYLNRTPASASNRKTWTFSAWIKRGALGTNNYYFGNYFANNDNSQLYFGFNTSNQLRLSDFNNTSFLAVTNAVYRDISAWYHIVLAFDTTQATSSNRWKIYVNGEQITSFSSSIYPSLNFDTSINTAQNHFIGYVNVGGYIFDGYMSEVNFVDGQQLTPTDFGEFDQDTGIWKPIKYTGTYGTNGFYLDFENSGSLGADQSGNGNNFTVNNLTSIDQVTDTPTNNFATGNPLVPTTLTYSDGNNTISHGADWKASPATIAVTQGKWYAEMKLVSTSFGATFGVEDMDLVSTWSAVLVGTSVNGRGYYSSDGTVYNNGSPSAFGATYTTGDIIGIALDMDNKFVYFSKNGVYQNSGVPTSGASGTGGLSLAGTTYAFAYGMYNSTSSLNFGNPPYTISSGNSDANGYGNFEYSVPSGYYSLCTKNLAEFG